MANMEGHGGAYFEGKIPHLNVTSAVDERKLTAFLQTAPDPAAVQIHRVRWTEKELNDAASRIGDANPPKNSAGFFVGRVSLDVPKNRLILFVDGDLEKAANVLPSIADSSMYEIRSGKLAPRVYEAQRTDDDPPFYAGNLLRGDITSTLCSSTAGMEIGTTEYVMTGGTLPV